MKLGRINCIPVLIVVLMLAVLMITGCGGSAKNGSSETDTSSSYQVATSSSDSFYPMDGVNAQNQPVKQYWKYVVTNGAVYQTSEGYTVTGQSNEVIYDPSVQILHSKSLWSMTGKSTSAIITESTDMQLVASGEKVYLSKEIYSYDKQGVVNGVYVHSIDTATYVLTSPYLEFFQGRQNLSDLQIGSTETVYGYGTKSWSSGENPDNSGTSSFQSSYEWSVEQSYPSMTIQGQTYRNVIKLKAASYNASGQEVNELFWLAQGVGIIKWSGPITSSSNGDATVMYELVETNLKQSL